MTERAARPRLAILSWSDGRFDSRTERVARSAERVGYDVVVYARWEPGLTVDEDRVGYRLIRVPYGLRQVLPRLGRRARPGAGLGSVPAAPQTLGDGAGRRAGRLRRTLRALAKLPVLRSAAAGLNLVLTFPVRPLAWAKALEGTAEPAAIWHGMWAGSLPAMDRLRRGYGGVTIYDSRDIFLHSRGFARLPRSLVAPLAWLERRWARRASAVITVNDAYARVIRQTLRVPVDAVVRNTPERPAEPSGPRPDLIRERLRLPPSNRVVLYQGRLMDGRGIEQAMEAILYVPDAVLVLMGFGKLRDALAAGCAAPPYRGKVALLEPVPPAELIPWTASADIALMAIQPTSLNHRFTTPNKLWEALAAGTPIVGSDLPGIAEVIRETGAGLTCDPTSPTSIASAVRSLLDLPAGELGAIRARALRAARERYNWETEVEPLLALYGKLR